MHLWLRGGTNMANLCISRHDKTVPVESLDSQFLCLQTGTFQFHYSEGLVFAFICFS